MQRLQAPPPPPALPSAAARMLQQLRDSLVVGRCRTANQVSRRQLGADHQTAPSTSAGLARLSVKSVPQTPSNRRTLAPQSDASRLQQPTVDDREKKRCSGSCPNIPYQVQNKSATSGTTAPWQRVALAYSHPNQLRPGRARECVEVRRNNSGQLRLMTPIFKQLRHRRGLDRRRCQSLAKQPPSSAAACCRQVQDLWRDFDRTRASSIPPWPCMAGRLSALSRALHSYAGSLLQQAPRNQVRLLVIARIAGDPDATDPAPHHRSQARRHRPLGEHVVPKASQRLPRWRGVVARDSRIHGCGEQLRHRTGCVRNGGRLLPRCED